MFAWMAQFADVSLRTVTRMEYLCATVMPIRSIGDSSTSVYPSHRSARFLESYDHGTYTINLYNTHFVTIYPEEEHSKGRGVHDAETVSFPRNEGQSGILIEPDG